MRCCWSVQMCPFFPPNPQMNCHANVRGVVAYHDIYIFYNPVFLAATKLYEWFSPSVRLSVRLSVTPFWLCSHHRIIMEFSGVITNGKSDVHAGQGQRSTVKPVTDVMTPLSRFRTVTPDWIHIWWWNDAQEVPYHFSMSFVKFQGHAAKKNVDFDPNWAFPDCNSSMNSLMAMEWCIKLEAT